MKFGPDMIPFLSFLFCFSSSVLYIYLVLAATDTSVKLLQRRCSGMKYYTDYTNTSGSRHYRPTPSSAYGIHLYPYPYPYPHPYPYPYPYPYIHIHTSDTDTDTDTDTDVYPDTDTDTDTDTDVYP